MFTTEKILEQFDAIENLVPSENWELNFQNKLDNARFSKYNSISKFNLLVMLLVLVNVGCIWKCLNTKTDEAKEDSFQIISEQLLIPNK